MGGRRSALMSIAAAIASLAPVTARAQSREPASEIDMAPEPTAPAELGATDAKEARRWLVAGQRLVKRASYLAARGRADDARAQLDTAVTAFQKSLDASDDPNVRYELALADEKLGKLDEAVRQLRVVVAAAPRPEIAKQAAVRLAALAAKVGIVTLRVAPAGASITLGGVELGTAPLGAPLVLTPGTYTLAFAAEGFQPKEAEITVEPGTQVERAVELEAIKIIVEPVRPIEIVHAEPAMPPPRRSRLPLVLGAGVTGAAAVGATVLGVLALRQHTTFVRATTAPLDREDARDDGRRLALASDVATATAVVAAGFTVFWYAFKYRPRPEKTSERRPGPVAAKLDMVPWVQSQSGGVSFAGGF